VGRRAVILLAAFAAAWPASAAAAPVLVLGHGGHVRAGNDPYLTTPALTPTRGLGPRAASLPRSGPTVTAVLSSLRRAGKLGAGAYRSYTAGLRSALSTARRLRGTRARELGAVIQNLEQIAGRRLLSPARLPVLFQTLDRNREWWSGGSLLISGQRVEFAGSQLVWEYYPGQGIQLTMLGNFGKADGLYTAGRAQYPQLRGILAELIPLAVPRAGGLSWEYYFHFDGGLPPWTSAMSQGTAIEALTRGFQATGQRSYLQLAHRALGLFTVPSPAGVRVGTPLGARYVQYTFTPGTSILNAFLQSLIGLYDYARVSGDPEAARLFAAGDAEARVEVPGFDTGAWSLYQPGIEDDLSYHQLVTGFLQQLCSRTGARVYCRTAQRFTADVSTPPALTLDTGAARRSRAFRLSFHLSKYSHVGIVLTLGSRTAFLTSAYFPYGVQSFRVPGLGRPGTYTVRLAATDLAGNFSRMVGALRVP
jgi:D-glucuronyl C5-epimerase-like protein